MKKYWIFCISFISLSHILAQHSIERLPYPINTKAHDEICPVFDFHEEKLFYTKVGDPQFNKTLIYNGHDLSDSNEGQRYLEELSNIYRLLSGSFHEDPVSSTFNQDIWYAKKINESYKVFHPGYPLNDALPNSICSVYGENDNYVLINQFFEKGGMKEGFSTIEFSEAYNSSFPSPFTIRAFDRISSEINLTMTLDKQIIIMAMKSEGRNDKDLFVCHKINDTLYGSPVPLQGVNTPYDETTPYITRDKTKIYFSSNRPGGNGGLDIYSTNRLDYTYKNWDTPTTFNRLLNTNKNESHPYITKDEKTIYYTSDQEGSSDIFKASLIRDTLTSPIIVHINVIKAENGKNFPAEISWRNTLENKDWPNFWRSNNGTHSITIEQNEPLDIKAENRSFKSPAIMIDPQELIKKGINEYYVELILTKDGILEQKKEAEEKVVRPELDLELKVGKKIVLKNIYFKRAKAEVVSESFPTLKSLASIIKSKPTLIIQVEGHTDNVGDKEALYNLSLARAAAIQTFLKSEGVAEYQVQIKGFGGEKPLTDNSTEAHRRKNRRVEIRVIQ